MTTEAGKEPVPQPYGVLTNMTSGEDRSLGELETF